MSDLAAQQEALLRALVARDEVPPGFDRNRIEATVHALLRKRADDVARQWPALLATSAARARFMAWADGRPKTTSFDDGLAFARVEKTTGRLDVRAAVELRRNRPRRLRR